MRDLKEIKQTKENEGIFDDFLLELLTDRTYTKSELMDLFHTNEREIRLQIQALALFKPVISLSCQKGYHVIPTKKLVEENDLVKIDKATLELRLQIKEFNARIKSLKKRMKPLIASLKVLEKAQNE